MSTAKTYNGWTNYETWAVALWLDNEQGSSRYWAEVTEEVYRDATATSYSTRAEQAVMNLAERLKDEHEQANPVADSNSVFSDLMSAALSEVDWDEIADHYLAEVDKDAIDAEDADEEDETDAEDAE